MLKRLLIAVFVLSLISAISGSALSDEINNGEVTVRELPTPQVTNIPSNLMKPRSQDGSNFNFQRGDQGDAPTAVAPETPPYFGVKGVDTTACYEQDYTNYGSTQFYTWTRSGGDPRELGMTFSSSENHFAEVEAAWFYLSSSLFVDPDSDGVDIAVTIYGNLGGVPDDGNIYHTETYTATTFGWQLVVFTGGPYNVGGDDYYIGVKNVDAVTDTVRFYSDDGDDSGIGSSSYRGVYRDGGDGLWYENPAPLGGWDPDYLITAVHCEYYSSCYYNTGDYGTGSGYIDFIPYDVGGGETVMGYSQRIVSEHAETLKVVEVWHYSLGGYYSSSPQTNAMVLELWNDNAGALDTTGGPLASMSMSGVADLYPLTGDVGAGGWDVAVFDVSSWNMVLTGPHHFSVRASSSNPADGEFVVFFTGPGEGGSGGSVLQEPSEIWVPGPSSSYLAWEFATTIEPYVCQDEFTDCEYQVLHSDDATNLWGLPPYPGAAQRVKGQQVNRVQEFTFQLWDDLVPSATVDAIIGIYTDGGGVPGALVYEDTIPYASLVDYPGWNTVVIPDVQVVGDFYVSLGQTTADSGSFTWLSEQIGPEINDGGLYWSTGSLAWLDLGNLVGEPYNFMFEVDFCGIPFEERLCDSTIDLGWSSYQGGDHRTGASQLSLGDAWCDLNLSWSYSDPIAQILFTQPVIYDDKVVCAFTDNYKIFDANTGALLMTIDSAYAAVQGHDFAITNDVRSAPTIQEIGGTTYMFLAGGFWQAVSAVDFDTYNFLWSRTVNDGDIWGQTRYSTFVVTNVGAEPTIVYGTESGRVVSRYVDDGILDSAWTTNPLSLAGETYASGAFDGTSIYFSAFNGASGDVYSIDAATGNINWSLSGAGGFQAVAVYNDTLGTSGSEGFSCGVSYDDNDGAPQKYLYAVSRLTGDHPADGVVYFLDPATGNHATPAQISNRGYYTTPVVDKNTIYVPTLTRWASPLRAGYLHAFAKKTGALNWDYISPGGGRYYSTAVLTCEPEGGADLLFVFNEDGFLECHNSINGDEIFRRRVFNASGYGPQIGVGGALAKVPLYGIDTTYNSHLIFADYWGNLYDMTQGADRGRLEFQAYEISVPVIFGTDAAYLVDAGPFLTNTGCADVNIISVTVDEAPVNGVDVPAFSAKYITDDYMARAEKIAGDLQRETFVTKFTQEHPMSTVNEDLYIRDSQERSLRNNTLSAGIPTWFVAMVHPVAGDILAPGDTMNLEFTVNQPLINRGPQDFYLTVESDDPDFFLNDPSLIPQAHVTVVGGCLIDTVGLAFGVGSANFAWVTNTGRVGDGDWEPHAYAIDGDDASYYQGFFMYAIDSYRVAAHSHDWSGTEADAIISMQPDPDFCNSDCAPIITTGVTAGYMTSDGGLTYDPVIADMVCKSFLDSVQNFDLGGGWDWTNYPGAPFDNSLTMGLYCNSRVYGVADIPEFNNFYFEIFEFEETQGNAVPGWYMNHTIDYDIGGDSCAMSAVSSAAWGNDGAGAGEVAHGSIKIPFGCGELGAGHDFDYNPMINVKGLTGNQALWNWTNYWDSVYYWMSSGAGTLDHQNMNLDDGEVLMTIAGHDFEANGTYSLGVANFALFGLANSMDPNTPEIRELAIFINKWAGFGRGDVNDDGVINLADIIYLAATVNAGGPGAIPFQHLSDVNADSAIDAGDINYLIDYYFNCGPCPMGDWAF